MIDVRIGYDDPLYVPQRITQIIEPGLQLAQERGAARWHINQRGNRLLDEITVYSANRERRRYRQTVNGVLIQ